MQPQSNIPQSKNTSFARDAAAAAYEDAALSGLCEEGCHEVAHAAFLRAQSGIDTVRTSQSDSTTYGNDK